MVSNLPGTYTLNIYQGDRIERTFRLRDATVVDGEVVAGDYKDLTGYTAQATIKPSKTDTVAATFTCTVDSDQEANKGKVTIVLTPEDSKALTEGNYVWDFQLKLDAEHIKTYLAGPVVVVGEVTADA